MFSSVPVGIRISVSASEGPDEDPNDVNQLGGELIELSIPKLKFKRTNDVSDLLIQIEDRGSGGLTRRGRAMPTSRSFRACLRRPRVRYQCSGCCWSGRGNVMAFPGGRCCPSAS
jgi:hypothetical protein